MRILWLKTELLHPVDKGGKIRTYQMLRELKKHHRITYLTLDDGTSEAGAIEKAEEYAHEVITVPHQTSAKFSARFYFELANNLASNLPYFMQKYVSKEMRAAINKCVAQNSFDVVVCDFLMPAVNMPKKIDVATVIFQHNVEAMIWRRHYEVQKNTVKKAYLKLQWQKTFTYERETCSNFDFVVAVSGEDAETMRSEYGIKNIADVPTGVDTHFFVPSGNVEKEAFNLVFTGSMDWLPNEDAIRWFTGEILPIIKRKIPQVSLTVVGRNPSQSLIELGKKDPSIVVTGRVSDVRPFMEKASVYVIPIRIGGGTRLKLYEAMAMEIPVVSTSVGAEGLPVKEGDEIILRDAPESFAEAVVKLLQDNDFALKLADQAANTVRENFSWQGVADNFAEICEQAIQIKRCQKSLL